MIVARISEFAWLFYSGVDLESGDGGEVCVSFVPLWQRLVETVIIVAVSVFYISTGLTTSSLPSNAELSTKKRAEPSRLILAALCLVFGIEVGYKFSSRELIWLLNPCHIVTIMQIILLCDIMPGRWTSALWRIHVYCLSGPTLAVVFPVTSSLLLPMEVFIYYAQHILILLIPVYMMYLDEPFSCEPFSDFSWSLISLGSQFIYHFIPLQSIALLTWVNLNCILCPAPTDPFSCRGYRLLALVHQSFFVIAHGKLFTYLGQSLVSALRPVACAETSNGVCAMQNGAAHGAGDHVSVLRKTE